MPAKTKTKKKKTKPKEAVYYATGRRKESIARVRLKPGKGEYDINGKKLEEYFGGRETVLVEIRMPLKSTGLTGKYNVFASVIGGGVNGQAQALKLGIARAILEISEDFKGELKKWGLLTRDPREKERKKPGLKKARKAPQFSKR
jgi:small subunit ribosomal protein S9